MEPFSSLVSESLLKGMLRIGWERSPVVAFNTGVIYMVFVKDDQKNLTQVQLAVPQFVSMRGQQRLFWSPLKISTKLFAHTVSVPQSVRVVRFVLLNATSSFHE